jgi:hypothetical protein
MIVASKLIPNHGHLVSHVRRHIYGLASSQKQLQKRPAMHHIHVGAILTSFLL